VEKQFNKLATIISNIAGKCWTFMAAVALVLIWAFTGPVFHFSETWQLVINTGTTIITFLMVFLIQNSQNRDGLAIQAKLDELIDATEGARNSLKHVESKEQNEIEEMRS
jgi:low affinity Fe/Cu permease